MAYDLNVCEEMALVLAKQKKIEITKLSDNLKCKTKVYISKLRRFSRL